MNFAKPITGAAMIAIWAGLGAGQATAQTAEMSHLGIPVERIGLVAFTLREQIKEDARGTIEAVANCGIKNIEFSGPDLEGDVATFQGIPITEIAELSKELGFAVPSLGVGADDLRDRLDKVIAAAQAVDANYVRISGSRPADGVAATEDDYLAVAALLNDVGGPLKDAGISVAYHNHEYELVDLGKGRSGMQVLFDETDPEKVVFELDLYWTEVAGGDAVSMFQANPGRFPMVHVKDAQKVTGENGQETNTFATVGQGHIDFAKIFQQRETAGTQYFFIENDQPSPDGVTSACESYAYMTSK